MKLYDLAGQDESCRFSPNCWRVRMAVAHKTLDVETIPWRFVEKDAIAGSGQGTVPVLVDGERVVHDSWQIANYLETTYPDHPSLFGGPTGRTGALFVKNWMDRVIHPLVARAIIVDLFGVLHEKDKAYFRESREKRFGTTLEEFGRDPDGAITELRAALAPLRATVTESPFLGGDAASFADHLVFGAFQWARVSSPRALLAEDDPVRAWMDRLLDLYGGVGRRQKAYEA